MKNMKKVLLTGVSFVMVAALSIGGTLAFFTDKDNATNVFTAGNVEIELNEDFQQGSQLVPGVDINKDVTITNTGETDAWVWYTYAIPAALDSNDASKNILHTNHAAANWDKYREDTKYWADGQTEANPVEKTWNVDYTGQPVGTYKDAKTGIEYNVWAVLYNGILKPGETTSVGLTNVYLDTKVDYVDGKYCLVKDGVATEIGFDLDKTAIYINAYAIQADEFDKVEDAFKAYEGQWGSNNGVYEAVTVTEVATAAELSTAAVANSNVVVLTSDIDMEGATVALADGVVISGDAALSNVTFTVADEYSATFQGVTFDETTTVQATADGSLTFENCEFEVVPAKFGNYSRGSAIIGSNQNAVVDLYLDGCTFNYTYEAGADLWNNAIFMWSSVENCVITNCEFNGYGFVAVKLMNVVDGANIVFENNKFNMSAKDDANWWYNTAVQIMPQHDNAMIITFKDNIFSGDYQTLDRIAHYYELETSDEAIVAEVTVMGYTALSDVTFNISGNTFEDGTAVTEDNFVVNVK